MVRNVFVFALPVAVVRNSVFIKLPEDVQLQFLQIVQSQLTPWKPAQTHDSVQCSDFHLVGHVGFGHICVEHVSPRDHPKGPHFPSCSSQLGGVHGHLRRHGGWTGDAPEPRPRAVQSAVGPRESSLSNVDLL